MEKIKKIIFIIPTLDGGGAERVVTVISNYLVDRDYDITIYLTRNSNVLYELNNGVKVKCIIPRSSNGLIKKVQTIKYLRKILKENRDSIVISFLTNENIYLTFSALGLKANVIVSERNDPYKTISRIKKPLVNFLYSKKQCKAVIFQTYGAMEFYNKKVQGKGVIIPNPIKEHLPQMYNGKRRKEIVTFARLEPQKNYPLLIEAFSMFIKNHDEYSLGIYGKGVMEDALKKLVKEKGLEDKVNFYGFSSDIHNKIKDAAMFVLPSDYEGLSNSMLEALAIGLPCICTDCSPGGARMYIKNEINGVLVPVGNKDSLYTAMAKVADNEEFAKKLSENATEIKRYLNVKSIGMMWEELLNNVAR